MTIFTIENAPFMICASLLFLHLIFTMTRQRVIAHLITPFFLGSLYFVICSELSLHRLIAWLVLSFLFFVFNSTILRDPETDVVTLPIFYRRHLGVSIVLVMGVIILSFITGQNFYLQFYKNVEKWIYFLETFVVFFLLIASIQKVKDKLRWS